MNPMVTRCAGPAAALLLLVGCLETPPVGRSQPALTAHCSIEVFDGDVSLGVKDMETDYVPHVVNCENGDAPTEALRALAVLARSYAYYKLAGGAKGISNSTNNQVYSCARDKLFAQKHLDAAKSTSGEVLVYAGNVIWPCYVAGNNPTKPPCVPLASGGDTCCTYNEGKSGTQVKPSPCGSSANPKNRGCLCQWGSTCLANLGKGYQEILRFYFGADIEIVRATGSCVISKEPSPPPGLERPAASDGQLGAEAGSLADGQPGAPESGWSGSGDGAGAPAGASGGCALAGSSAGSPAGAALLLLLVALGGGRLLRRRRSK